jgi:signal transduction histidine kinase
VRRAILASADRLIFRRREISRLADDTAPEGVYLAAMRFLRYRPDPVKLDWAVAALLAVGGQLEVWLGNGAHGARLVIAISGTLLAVAVAVRRRYPLAAGITAVVAANAVALAWRPPSLVTYGVAWMCAVYALAVWTSARQFALGVAVFALPTLVARAAGAGPSGGVEFTVIALVVMLLVRQGIRGRDRRAEMAERERELAAREAVVEERARIARELHDVIAHNVSMMVVQAGAERRVLDGANASTREVLQTIEQIGRGALTEMRRLVGMLRSDGEDPLAPQPGLDDVATLVGQVREAGLPVELTVEGEPRDLPAGIELSAYRIVQEALTNALKHAGDAHAQVSIRYGADSLELEVLDDGRGGAALGNGGHGLVGMRERVALYGGRFDASRRPGGGFAVRAKLPIT